jgi:hypothetical protein
MVGNFHHFDRIRYTENPKIDSDVSCCLLNAGCLLILHLNREDGDGTFLRNVSEFLLDYTTPHSTIYYIYF